MAKKHFIYKITNNINGKIYIGQTTNVNTRWRRHRELSKRLKYKTHLYNAMRKYGIENFSIDVIEEVSKSRVDEIEQYWIAKLNTIDEAIGYNIHIGGNGGDTFSNKTETEKFIYRKKMSDIVKLAHTKNPNLRAIKIKNLTSSSNQLGKRNTAWNGYWYLQYPSGKLRKFTTLKQMMAKTSIARSVIGAHVNKNTPLCTGKFKGCIIFKSKEKLI